MSWLAVLETVAPAFALVALGFAFGGFVRLEVRTLTEVVVYLAGPALIFGSLSTGPLPVVEASWLATGTVVIVVGVGLLVGSVSAVAGLRPGRLYLPAMFMNAGNMLLPLSLFAFGDEGLRLSLIIFVTITMLQSTLGVAIASGSASPLAVFRLPYVYALAAALAVRAGGVDVPEAAMRPVHLLGDMAIPLMLLALGLRLRTVRIRSWRAALLVSVARVGGGYAIAATFVAIAGVDGLARSCLLLASVMPSAVVNFVFAEKYGDESGDVATAVVVSTVISLVTTPLVLAYGL